MLTRRPGSAPAGPSRAAGAGRAAGLIRRVGRGMAVWARAAGAVGVVLVLVGMVVAARWGLAGAGGLSTGRLLIVAAVAGMVGILTGPTLGTPGVRRDAGAEPPRRGWRARRALWVAVAVVLLVVLAAGVAWADPLQLAQQAPPPPAPTPASPDLDTVIKNLRNWLIGICAGAATLFFTLGGLRYMGANGDPGEIESAKRAFRNAAVGYGLAILAPLFLTALKSVVGA